MQSIPSILSAITAKAESESESKLRYELNKNTNHEARGNGEGAKDTAAFDAIDFDALHHHRLNETVGHGINGEFVGTTILLHELLHRLKIHSSFLFLFLFGWRLLTSEQKLRGPSVDWLLLLPNYQVGS